MQPEIENDNSEIVEEVDTPETTPEEVSEEVIDPEADLLAKNRQLYERAKKAEARAKELELQRNVSDDPYADEDDVKREVEELRKKVLEMEERSQMESLTTQYPSLKDKLVEFDEYRQANPGMNLTTSAKAFLAENDLLGQPQKRKGLEKAGGGVRTPPTGKMSVEDAKRLRETNYNEYRKMLMSGKIQI